MENDRFGSDNPEVRRLKEKIRALEFQLSQQSSLSRNGANGAPARAATIGYDLDCEIIPVESLDLTNCKHWLQASSLEEDTGSCELDVIGALRQAGKQIEKALYDEVWNAEQAEQERRRDIDSRTFTRPKKRMGQPNLELFESLARCSNPGEPVLSRTAKSMEGELLSDMTCSLLDSSLINSITIYEPSPDNEAQTSVSYINKKQRVTPVPQVDKLSDDSSGDFDNCSNITVSGPATFHINTRSCEVEAMEISSPDMEATDNSLGIMDSQLLDAGLLDSITLNSTPQEDPFNTMRHCMNSTFTTPKVNNLSSLQNNAVSENTTSEDQCLNQTFKKDKVDSVSGKQLNSTFTTPLNDVKKHHSQTGSSPSTLSVQKPALNTTFTPPTNYNEEPHPKTTPIHLIDHVRKQSPFNTNFSHGDESSDKKVALNTTFTPSPREGCGKPVLNSTFTPPTNSCSGKPNLNSTFVPTSNGVPASRIIQSLPRPASTDSGGADDDQLSSTSDSSHTSATRLMSVGDVQNIARLQEESLVMSTPKQRCFVSKKVFENFEKISPVLGRPDSEPEINKVGYGSDQSESSRSPLSSLQSSPASSPYGSNSALPTSQPRHHADPPKISNRPNGVLQRKDTYSMIPPAKSKASGLQPPAPVPAPTLVAPRGRPTARSGLRPPMVYSRASGVATAGTTGLPRPAGTGIPRPASATRIPPPTIRASSSSRKKEWTDECY